VVLNHFLHCPVRIVEGHPYDEALETLIAARPWALVTSRGWITRGAADVIATRCSDPLAVIADVEANPKLNDVIRLAPTLEGAGVVVALGGGSVIDAAKGMVALNAVGGDVKIFKAHLREGRVLPGDMTAIPIIAVPTTSGTGSEVTRWGTIWGDDAVKHSVTDAKLYPSHAVLDPELCRSMPRELTLSTGLDAISHAMEAVWNQRHTSATDSLAETAIRMVHETLEEAMDRPDDVVRRERMQSASMIAGLAMGTTQTALAHSISYPFTALFDMPHGLACSFTLAEVARFNGATSPERLAPIAAGMECSIEKLPVRLEAWFDDLGVGELVARYVAPTVTDELGDKLITRARAANNIRDVDGAQARQLARAALDRLCGGSENDTYTRQHSIG
jgi:phosphonate metabolism-associated iron-containing alcohol dehydrogenase